MLNISSSSDTVRTYGFSGKAPSAYRAPDCTGQMQLLLINLDDLENVTVALPEQGDGWRPTSQSQLVGSYAAWILTPPPGTMENSMSELVATRGADPFATSAVLNGQLLPDTVDTASDTPTGRNLPVEFLGNIPVRPVRGKTTIELPPISITFLCSSD